MVAILLFIISVPLTFSIFGMVAAYYAFVLRENGAEVVYGVKGGYFVTLNENVSLSTYIHDSQSSLDYLSRNYRLTICLKGNRLAAPELGGLRAIKGNFHLTLLVSNFEETDLEPLIAIHNLQSVETPSKTISKGWLARFRETRSQ